MLVRCSEQMANRSALRLRTRLFGPCVGVCVCLKPLFQRFILCAIFAAIMAEMASLEDEEELLVECIDKVRAVT